MMDNKVYLNFDNSLTSLAGYEYGQTVYDEQVKNKLNLSNDFEIVFPDQITNVAYSFVQGFFKEIVDEIGLLETEKRTTITSKNSLHEMIMKKLLY